MKTKHFYLCLLLLVLGTANVWADKYYQPAGNHNDPTRHTTLTPGMKFMIYNTVHKSFVDMINHNLDYTPRNVATQQVVDGKNILVPNERTRNDRYINTIKLSSSLGENSLAITSEERAFTFVDKTETTFKVKAGEQVTPQISHDGTWMNAAVFIDFNGDGFAVTKTVGKIKASTTLPSAGKPEFIYHMKNGNAKYANSTTGMNVNNYDKGQFAFYAVEGVEGAYYIYSVGAQKWLTYTKADSYGNKQNFLETSDTKIEGAYFQLVNYEGNNYEIHPYKNDGTVAALFLNWYQGGGNTIGLWEQGGSNDTGSRWSFELIENKDLVTYSFYSYNDNGDAKGFDSNWNVVDTNDERLSSVMPSFTAPAVPGYYRMRYMLDYNSIDPNGNGTDKTGGGGNTMSNGGAMVDVILEVVADTDYTGFLYNNSTALGLTHFKARDKMIYNECHVFELESAGETDAYYIKSLSTGTYVGLDGSTSHSTPQKLYIYSWPQAVTKDTDTYGDNGIVLTNGAIKQDITVNSEASNYSIVQNSQLIDQSKNQSGVYINRDANPYNVFVITNEAKDTYWNGDYKKFATGATGHPFAFYDISIVDKTIFPYIEDLHIYSRCDLYSAQKIYGYIKDAAQITQSHEQIIDGSTPCDVSRLIDGDHNTYSATNRTATAATHYLTIDLRKSVSSLYLYMKRRADALDMPTRIRISVSNDNMTYTNVPNSGVDFNNITNGELSTGLDSKVEYFSPFAIDFGGNYQYVRIEALETSTPGYTCIGLSELYLLPNTEVVHQALTYTMLDICDSPQNYENGIKMLNEAHSEVKILSGVPLPGNKYYIYADAYDANKGMYVNYDLCATETTTDGVTTYGLSLEGNYNSVAETADADYYAWICERLPNGKLTFRNVKTGMYLANGTIQEDAYEWSYNTNETCRHGVPLKNSASQYLAAATKASDGSKYWMGDVKLVQDQTEFYTYVDDEENTVTDETHRICTDFVFLPIERAASEKKITILADPLAVRNSVFRYNGVQYTTFPFSQIMMTVALPASVTSFGEGNYYLATMKNGNDNYVAPSTDDTDAAGAGRFVFCKHSTLENAYYIYSLGKDKWLTYDNAITANGAHNIIVLADERDENDYFVITDVTGYAGYKQLKYNTQSNLYVNWFEGVGANTTLGGYQNNGAADAGSRFALAEIDADDNITIDETCGTYHKFIGFYKKNSDGTYTAPAEPVATKLRFSDIADGDTYEARFEIVQPFNETILPVLDSNGALVTPATMHFYKIKNVNNGRYASFAGDDACLKLVEEANVDALSLFYFTGAEFDNESHAKAIIESAVTVNKLYNEGSCNANGQTAAATWNLGGVYYYVQPNQVLSGGNVIMGYAISRTMLDATNNPGGLCANVPASDDLHMAGGYNVEDMNAFWVFEPVEDADARAMLNAYITKVSGELDVALTAQSADWDEADGVDTTYPVYSEERITAHRTRIAELQNAASTLGVDLYDIKGCVQQLYKMNNNIASSTLKLPTQTSHWDRIDDYNPEWYYIRNVEASWSDNTKSYAAKYVADNENMTFSDILAEGGKTLNNLFYVGGAKGNEGLYNEYLQNCCIHNFAAYYHKDNAVVDKTLVSEDKVMYENISITGEGKPINKIPGVKTLDNAKGWRILVEATSNGNSYNNWGSCIIASSEDPLKNNYTNEFQVYMKADGYIVVKLSDHDDYSFNHIRGSYEKFSVEMIWTPNTNVDDVTVEGKLYIKVTNNKGVAEEKTSTRNLKDITLLSSALPRGINITNLQGIEIQAMQWNEEHSASNWFVLPSTNKNYPGHSIVKDGASDENLGWHNAESQETKIENYVGKHDYSTWEFVKVVDFRSHMLEILDLWNIDKCVVYYRPLVELYNELKALYDKNTYDQETFNAMVRTIRKYNSLPKDEFYAPKADKFYTLRPAYTQDYVNAVAVNAENNVVKSGTVYAHVYKKTATPVAGKTYYIYANATATASTWYLYNNNGNLAIAATEPAKDNDKAYCWTCVTDGYGNLSFKNSAGMYLADDANGFLSLGITAASYKMEDGSLVNYTQGHQGGKHMVTDADGTLHGSYTSLFNKAGSKVNNGDWCSEYIFVERNPEYDSRGVWYFEDIDLSTGVTANVMSLHTRSSVNALAVSGETALSPTSSSTVTLVPIGSSVINVKVGDKCLTRQNGAVDTDINGGDREVIIVEEVEDVFNPVTSWYLEEVVDNEDIFFPISVATHGHGTLMLGYDAKIPDGISAFWPRKYGPVLTSNYISMQSYENGIVPANTPVMLKIDGVSSDPNDFELLPERTPFKFYYSNVGSVEDTGDKMEGVLYGALYNTAVDCDEIRENHAAAGYPYSRVYMLQRNVDVPRLYWIWENYNEQGNRVDAEGTEVNYNVKTDKGGHIMCNANKAYFVMPYDKVAATSFSLRYDGDFATTDIERIEDAANDTEVIESIFDLQGRKLNEITEPGIYIINGKKVSVK